MATWTKDNVLSFIDEYRSHECLWKVKSKDYSNRLKREQAYQNVVQFVKTFEPEADKEFIIKKFNNLRNSFRKQLRKQDGLKDSGSGAEEVDLLEPKLWYFNALTFLRDQEIPRPSQFKIDPDIAQESTYAPLPVEIDVPGSPIDLPTPGTSDSCSRPTTPLPTPTAAQGAGNSSNSSNISGTRPAKRKASVENELLTLISGKRITLNCSNVPEEDQFDTFAKTIGHRLRHMPREQGVHAQKLISDVMYEADLGTLSRGTAVVNRNSARDQPQLPSQTSNEVKPS